MSRFRFDFLGLGLGVIPTCEREIGEERGLERGSISRHHGFRLKGFRIQDSGFRVQDLGFRVQGSGFRI
jgi:hypothetical protein